MNELSAFFAKLVSAGLDMVLFFALALWGGTVNYLTRVKQGLVEVFSFRELVGEWAISGFAGVLTYMMCLELGFSGYLTGILTGISGHLGGRTISMFENYFKQKFPLLDKKASDRYNKNNPKK